MAEQRPRRVASPAEQLARYGIISEVPMGPTDSIDDAVNRDAKEKDLTPDRVLAVGDWVAVERSPRAGSSEPWLDLSGWTVVKTNPNTTKVTTDTLEGVLEKTVDTAKLMALQERLDEKLMRDLGEEAVEDSGVENPVDTDPLNSLSLEDRRDVLQYQTLVQEQHHAHDRGDWLIAKDCKEAAVLSFSEDV